MTEFRDHGGALADFLEQWMRQTTWGGRPLAESILPAHRQRIADERMTDPHQIETYLNDETAGLAPFIAAIVEAYEETPPKTEPSPKEASPDSGRPMPPSAAAPKQPSTDIAAFNFSYPGNLDFPVEDDTIEARRADWDAPVELSWPAPDPSIRLVRLIANDDYPPFDHQVAVLEPGQSPPRGQNFEIGRCLGPVDHLSDPRPYLAARRYYAVLGYAGDTPPKAAAAKPQLLACGQSSCLLRRPVIDYDDTGRVVGSWENPEGVTVQVHRARAADRRSLSTEGHVLSEQASGLCLVSDSSFVDDSLVPGESYLYMLSAKAEDDNTRFEWTCPKLFERPPRLRPVTDLRVDKAKPEDADIQEKADGTAECKVAWTAPEDKEAKVRLYRSANRPDERSLLGKTIPAADLANLSLGQREVEGEQRKLVLWPKRPSDASDDAVAGDGDDLFLTPVTVWRNRYACVGAVLPLHRIPEVRDVKVIERVTRQLIAFAWPGGASRVRLGLAKIDSTDTQGDDEVTWTDQWISRRDYDNGGTLDPMGQLHRSDRLTLQGAIIRGGGLIQYGQPSSPVEYPGLDIIDYGINVGSEWIGVGLRARAKIAGRRLAFCLVGGQSLLPLLWRQGCRAARGRRERDAAEAETVVFNGLDGQANCWFRRADLEDCAYIRLVLKDPDPSLAIIDPPIQQLRLETTIPE
ncbi:MAG: hypothetical protein LBI84_02310 [Propionibacteriaceae bacterium]|nr:hypothetical protein [Propionibacteriaceae bacterium]